MQITPLASTISDNWFYAIEDNKDLILVDPIDARVAIDYARQRTPERVRIFNTHGHPDHIGGNDEVVQALRCEVIASAHPDIMDPPAQTHVKHGDTVEIGDTTRSEERRVGKECRDGQQGTTEQGRNTQSQRNGETERSMR